VSTDVTVADGVAVDLAATVGGGGGDAVDLTDDDDDDGLVASTCAVIGAGGGPGRASARPSGGCARARDRTVRVTARRALGVHLLPSTLASFSGVYAADIPLLSIKSLLFVTKCRLATVEGTPRAVA